MCVCFEVVLGFRQQVWWSFCEFTLNIRVFCGGSRYFWCKRGDRNSRKLERRNNIHVLDPVEVGRFSSRPWKLSGVVTFLFANFMEENWFWSNPCECQERLLGHSREKLLFYTKCSGELVKVVRRLNFRHGWEWTYCKWACVSLGFPVFWLWAHWLKRALTVILHVFRSGSLYFRSKHGGHFMKLL